MKFSPAMSPAGTIARVLLACSICLSGSFLTLPAIADTAAEQSWSQTQKAADQALYEASYGNAERLLKQAVIKAAMFGDGDPRYAKSLGELGRLYTTRGRFGEAEPLLEEELHSKEVAIGDDSGQIIPAMGSMISFYLDHGTASKADPLTDKMLSFIEGKLDEHRAGAQGKLTLKKGMPLMGWAGAAAPSMRDPVIEWAITCDAVGNQYRTHGNFDLAERLFKAALDVKETVLGKQHLSLANSYDNLGTICMDRGEDGQAESFFRYALESTERILPAQNPQVFSRLDKLAKCLIKEKKYDEAEALYLRAQDFFKEMPSKNGSEARATYALGSLYIVEQKYDLAAPQLKKALELAQAYYGPDSVLLIPYLQRYADSMHFLGRDSELGELKARASMITGASPL